MELSAAEFEMTRRRFLDCDITELAEFMCRLQFRENLGGIPAEPRAVAEEIGWVDPASGQLTKLGWGAADSCREYKLWIARDWRLPFEGGAPHLSLDFFSGKSVVEIGCGIGVNLMSLAGTTKESIGIEPNRLYRQLGSLFREIEGYEALDIRAGQGEATPFEDERFDVVLCVSAHQYFDIRAAIRELERIVKPGGEILIIGGTLGTYFREGLRPVFRGSVSALKQYGVTILNSFSYMLAERRAFVPRNAPATSTAYPVYPGRGTMCRWLEEAGLRVKRPLARLPPETCFRAKKKGPAGG